MKHPIPRARAHSAGLDDSADSDSEKENEASAPESDASPSVLLRVADETNLESLTEEGWRLRETLYDEEVICTTVSVPLLPTGLSYPVKGEGDQLSVVKRMRFLLERSADSVMAALKERAEEAASALEEANETLSRTRYAFKESEERLSRQEQVTQDLEKRCATVCEERDRLRVAHRKLEGDFAKIREAYGDLALRKILEPE